MRVAAPLMACLCVGPLTFPVTTLGAVEPFEATYAVTYKGFRAGSSVFELHRETDGTLSYSSRSNASGAFRLFLGHEITQRSWMVSDAMGVRPLRYAGDDGSPKTDRDMDLRFDWKAGRVTGTQEDETVDLPLAGEVQDPMSAQVALMHEVSEGRKPRDYRLVDKTQLQTYVYSSAGTERLQTPFGTFDTVVYVSRREGAKHSIRIWLAPSLGFVPLQAEQARGPARVDHAHRKAQRSRRRMKLPLRSNSFDRIANRSRTVSNTSGWA